MSAAEPIVAGSLDQTVDHDDFVEADRASVGLSFGQCDQRIPIAVHVSLAGGAIHPFPGEPFQHFVMEEDHSIEFVPVGEQTNMVVNGFNILHGRRNARPVASYPEGDGGTQKLRDGPLVAESEVAA
ncbi:hypothetical protein [Sphingomonas abietis]|uniref:Uncharacterized protein n=1 Tax=Sphingomonas abietis TaxID=3012344 RepID=A0ABY7NLC1_9SPHN|nr:hypothetical protein [Sphingomonas abietis]WBO22294.1 hypothetical protein PBT88_19460 [Sphingomonas abietis]